jgi:hypothetical protein
VTVPITQESSSTTTNPPPPLMPAPASPSFALTARFSIKDPPEGWLPPGFNPYDYVPAVANEAIETSRESRSFLIQAQWALLPVGRTAAVVVLSRKVRTNTTIQKAVRSRFASLSTQTNNNRPVWYGTEWTSTQEGNFYSFSFGVLYYDQWVTAETTSQEDTPAAPVAYYITEKTVRAINAPQRVNQWLLAQSGDAVMTSATQGLGAEEAGNVRLATPQTIEAVTTDDPQSWSPTWLQFSRSDSNPSQLVARKIRALDPISHEPLDPTSGTLVPGLTVPLQLPNLANLPPGTNQTLLLAWDWGKPALCRQRLLNLGFSPEDLAP